MTQLEKRAISPAVMWYGHDAIKLVLIWYERESHAIALPILSYIYPLNLCCRKMLLALHWASESLRRPVKPKGCVPSPQYVI